MRRVYIILLSSFLLLAISLLTNQKNAFANAKYQCDQNGGAEGESPGNGYSCKSSAPNNCGSGFCSSSAVCDDKVSDPKGFPCINISALQCKCDTGDSAGGKNSFHCGQKAGGNDFDRSCATGQICDSTITSGFPCSNATVKNPCPGGICNTAIGKIDVSNAPVFVGRLFEIILSLSGGIAVLIIILSGYNFVLSQGNPEKVQAARETLTAAIVGLLFIIFSAVILQLIGVDILGIPNFTK